MKPYGSRDYGYYAWPRAKSKNFWKRFIRGQHKTARFWAKQELQKYSKEE